MKQFVLIHLFICAVILSIHSNGKNKDITCQIKIVNYDFSTIIRNIILSNSVAADLDLMNAVRDGNTLHIYYLDLNLIL